jgi:hypothetical protein
MEKFTFKQMLQISHAFGIDLFKAVMSDKLKDKKLPDIFYRNRYQTENDNIFEELVLNGFAEKAKFQDLPYYFVNESGENKYREQYNEFVKYKSLKDRDLEYLKNKINFYCSFYNYRFGDDNSKHIISAYLNYWIKKHYVSHTTEDTILHFKNELKSYYKRGLLKL